jgi:FkbH-like protein
MRTFSELKKNLKGDYARFPRVKLAILGDSPTQLLAQALRAYGFDAQLDYEIFEADVDQIDRQILDPTSELHASSPDYVLIFESTSKMYTTFAKASEAARATFARDAIAHTSHLVELLAARPQGNIVWCNYPELGEDVFGNFANKVTTSFTYQLRKLNVELMQLARRQSQLFVCDLAAMQASTGRLNAVSAVTYVNTGMVFALDTWVAFAKRVTDIVRSLRGAFKKCLVLDLDNTLWGGIVGDDGIEGIQLGDLGIGRAYIAVQRWAKLLKERGILLAICSKNDEVAAKEPFAKHPDMLLRLSDIAVFVANWENKVDNIRHIQGVLKIGMDSIVFVDDNPFERSMVRGAIPELCVPELPEDPADYASYLESLNLFETASISQEDSLRTRQYQDEAARATFERTFATEGEYLASLEMESVVEPFGSFNGPRIAQLSQRSNQFNLRTVRYSERDVAQIAIDPLAEGISFGLSDRFGDYGLVGVIVLRAHDDGAAFVDTWLMSCRVLKRRMEQFMLNVLVEKARIRGWRRVVGEYCPTTKNAMVQDHYARLGFHRIGPYWELPLDAFTSHPVAIRTKVPNE